MEGMDLDAMRSLLQKPLGQYAVAVLTVVGATLVGLPLHPKLGAGLPFALLIGAVLVTAWLAGTRPALVTALLGALSAARFFLPPHNSWAVTGAENQAGIALFVLVACGVVAV